MKNLALSMLIPAALFAVALQAQLDVTGTWQGTLQAGRELRTVVKISKTGADLTAVLYSIDQGGGALPASGVTLQGSTLRFGVPGVGATYEGKISADGTSITGAMTQGDKPLTLNLKRATAETAWAIPEPAARPKPMAADANPTFEVATIKPSQPDTPGVAITIRGRSLQTRNTTLSNLVTFAYGLHPRQITGAPPWLESEKFDVTAQPDGEGQPNEKQWRSMLQQLLADRFKLTFHREKKELPVYALLVDKNGSKLTKNDTDPNGLPGLFFRGLGVLPARNATMVDFAGLLQTAVLDRPVVDQTGLTGRFDFTLTWTPDETQFGGLGIRVPPPTDSATAPPGLFTAVQEQLGLKLDSTKAPVDVLVVDRVEKPTEN
jgi:bla regulator protein blaR1